MVPFGYGAPSRRLGTAWEKSRQARVAAAVAVAAVDRIAVVERQRIQRRPIGTIRHIRVSESKDGSGRDCGMSNSGRVCLLLIRKNIIVFAHVLEIVSPFCSRMK